MCKQRQQCKQNANRHQLSRNSRALGHSDENSPSTEMISRGLESKYSRRGLSEEDQKKVITTLGSPRKKPIGAIKIEERVDLEVHKGFAPKKVVACGDDDGDIPMIALDDEEEVQVIADYVEDTRQLPINIKRSAAYLKMEEEINDLTPQPLLLRQTYMVLDTNFILSHLNIVDSLCKLHLKYHHRIVIPTTVIRELDGLKGSEQITTETNEHISGRTVGYLARWANDWIYLKLADSNSAVRGQKLNERLDPSTRKDDAILDCCLYLKEKEEALVILLSNDKNLCMKALANEVLTVSYRKGMSAELIAKMSYNESHARENTSPSPSPPKLVFETRPNFDPETVSNLEPLTHNTLMEANNYDHIEYLSPIEDDNVVYGSPTRSQFPDVGSIQTQYNSVLRPDLMTDPTPINSKLTSSPTAPSPQPMPRNEFLISVEDLNEACQLVYKESQTLALEAIDNCMKEAYGDDLELIGYSKDELRTLKDSGDEIVKRWIAVFSDYFRRGSIKPYKSFRGKKTPINYQVPQSPAELSQFVSYWSKVLKNLYVHRRQDQKDALDKILERWSHISNNIKG